jgi:hypothetical protein
MCAAKIRSLDLASFSKGWLFLFGEVSIAAEVGCPILRAVPFSPKGGKPQMHAPRSADLLTRRLALCPQTDSGNAGANTPHPQPLRPEISKQLILRE